MRFNPSTSVERGQPKLSRTNPSPPFPNVAPRLSATPVLVHKKLVRVARNLRLAAIQPGKISTFWNWHSDLRNLLLYKSDHDIPVLLEVN